MPIVFIFNNYRINVLGRWEGEVNCSIIARLKKLLQLYNSQRSVAITHNNLKIEDDLQVIQNFITLMSLPNFDIKELFSLFIGDFFMESVSKFICYWSTTLHKKFLRTKYYTADLLTEEWCYAPGSLEVAYFIKEIKDIERATKILIERMEKMENI